MLPPRIGITCSWGMGETQPIETLGRLYIDGVIAAGGFPVLLPTVDPSFSPVALHHLDGLLLTGGGDVDPGIYGDVREPECGEPDVARDAWEIALVCDADDIPILGICRGAQVLNVVLQGGLVQHLPGRGLEGHDDERVDGEVHEVALVPGSLIHRVIGADAVRVNTLHHQSIDPARVGLDLQVTGVAEDGVVEVIEDPVARVLGVQWHPELMLDRPEHQRLFDWLVDPDRFRPE
ncbi:MAG: glutamine amidotransferase [Ilumatobacteraceae bacterium]|nr:glutamine amidotransferase [Ilumatobacteraceae bacterium]